MFCKTIPVFGCFYSLFLDCCGWRRFVFLIWLRDWLYRRVVRMVRMADWNEWSMAIVVSRFWARKLQIVALKVGGGGGGHAIITFVVIFRKSHYFSSHQHWNGESTTEAGISFCSSVRCTLCICRITPYRHLVCSLCNYPTYRFRFDNRIPHPPSLPLELCRTKGTTTPRTAPLPSV